MFVSDHSSRAPRRQMREGAKKAQIIRGNSNEIQQWRNTAFKRHNFMDYGGVSSEKNLTIRRERQSEFVIRIQCIVDMHEKETLLRRRLRRLSESQSNRVFLTKMHHIC